MSICAIVGLFGLLGMTWLFPVLSRLLTYQEAQKSPQCEFSLSAYRDSLLPLNLCVLIPSHNDEIGLRRTLEAVSSSTAKLRSSYPNIYVSVVVGIDGGTDQSALIASSFGAHPVISARNRGKWRTLVGLKNYASAADWVALVDTGIVWAEDFLLQVLPHLMQAQLMGIAPSYRNVGGGAIEQSLWRFERHLKTLEDSTGGPISIHGATVLYRAPQLLKAFEKLKRRRWLNDDIVIPLILRSLYPTLSIKYLPHVTVYDSFLGGSRQFVRRRRLVLGNIQWIRSLLPTTYKFNLAAGTVALRRVFRVFWAYWLLLLAGGVVGALYQIVGANVASWLALSALVILGGIAIALRSTGFTQSVSLLTDAARASIMAPFYLFNYRLVRGAHWR